VVVMQLHPPDVVWLLVVREAGHVFADVALQVPIRAPELAGVLVPLVLLQDRERHLFRVAEISRVFNNPRSFWINPEVSGAKAADPKLILADFGHWDGWLCIQRKTSLNCRSEIVSAGRLS